MEGTGNGGRKEERRLPAELAEERDLALLCLLFPNCSVKPESWDRRLRKLVTGCWPGWEMAPAAGDTMDGCDRA